MNPANVDFGNPNDNPTTFPAELPKESLNNKKHDSFIVLNKYQITLN